MTVRTVIAKELIKAPFLWIIPAVLAALIAWFFTGVIFDLDWAYAHILKWTYLGMLSFNLLWTVPRAFSLHYCARKYASQWGTDFNTALLAIVKYEALHEDDHDAWSPENFQRFMAVKRASEILTSAMSQWFRR